MANNYYDTIIFQSNVITFFSFSLYVHQFNIDYKRVNTICILFSCLYDLKVNNVISVNSDL